MAGEKRILQQRCERHFDDQLHQQHGGPEGTVGQPQDGKQQTRRRPHDSWLTDGLLELITKPDQRCIGNEEGDQYADAATEARHDRFPGAAAIVRVQMHELRHLKFSTHATPLMLSLA
jgi:hypothetical protein